MRQTLNTVSCQEHKGKVYLSQYLLSGRTQPTSFEMTEKVYYSLLCSSYSPVAYHLQKLACN